LRGWCSRGSRQAHGGRHGAGVQDRLARSCTSPVSTAPSAATPALRSDEGDEQPSGALRGSLAYEQHSRLGAQRLELFFSELTFKPEQV